MRQQGEASVEEILASIKQVIARDNRAGALEERRRRESEGLKNLSAEIDAGEQDYLQTAAEPEFDDADSVLNLSEADFVEQDEDFAASGPDHTDAEDDTPLTTDPLRDSIRENFAALAMLAKPGMQPQIVRSGETSLEGLVRELLRPMLSEWIDKNLPGMVEKMVQAEIARIAGKRG
jgi:cell pole-organizing protein PopZ